MTSPFPPPSPEPWRPDGTGEPAGSDDPPVTGPTSYDLYPPDGGWPDQPVTGPPQPNAPQYPPQQGYPPPAPPYAPQPQYAPAPQYLPPQPVGPYMPGPPVKSGGNKGILIGGVIAGVVVLLCVVVIVVVNVVKSSTEEEPMAYSPTVAAAAPGGEYDNPADLCEQITTSRFETATGLTMDETPSNASTDDSDTDGDGYSTCSIHMNREDPFDYSFIYIDLTVDSDSTLLASTYDSEVSAMSGSAYSITIGEESKASASDSGYGEDMFLVLRNGNAVLSINLQTSQDNATREAVANLMIDTANEVLNAID